MSAPLPSGYDQVVHRLMLGVEPLDAAQGQGIAQTVEVVLDGVPGTSTAGLELAAATLGLRPLRVSSTGRFVLLHRSGQSTEIGLRLFDSARRFVPRRLRYEVPADIANAQARVRRPALFPGATHDASMTATGLRGRVLWSSLPNASPVRWARIEASLGDQVLGRAHGDDRGEFLLFLPPSAAGFGELLTPLELDVTAFAPAEPPDATSAPAARDPLWDLPVEPVPLSADPDRVSSGEALPTGYAATASSRRRVRFELGRLRSDEPPFSITI